MLEICDCLEQAMISLADHPILVSIANGTQRVKSQIFLQTNVIPFAEAQISVQFSFLVLSRTQVKI